MKLFSLVLRKRMSYVMWTIPIIVVNHVAWAVKTDNVPINYVTAFAQNDSEKSAHVFENRKLQY